MNNKGRGLVIVIVVLAAICIAFLTAGYLILNAWGGFDWWNEIPNKVREAEEYSIDDTEQAEIDDYVKFKISTVSADIELVYADTDVMTVDLKGSYRSGRGQVELRKETSGNMVHIYVHYPKMSGLFSWNDTDLTVTLPADMEGKKMVFNTVSGEIDIPAGFEAEMIDVNSTSGDVQADEIRCVEFESGNVSGTVDLTGYVTESIRIESVSGDTELMLFSETKRIDVNSVSGSIEVFLPKDAEFRFDYDTVSGDFRCDFPVYAQGSKNDKSGYTSEDAEMEMELGTVSGDLNIRN